MRHAKSDWNTGSSDFERPLNNRGLKAAPQMAIYLKDHAKFPDLIISSSAVRAITTAEIVKKNIQYDKEIQQVSDFYFGDSDSMMDTLLELEDTIQTVLLVGHNPTVEELVNKLSSEYHAMPTASIVSVLAHIDKWENLQIYENSIEWAVSPKNL